jgi:hypothetical protein
MICDLGAPGAEHDAVVDAAWMPAALAGPLSVQATLRSFTSIDAVQLTPSALDSWRAIWVMPPSDIVTVQRVWSPIHLITSPSISSRERWTLPKLS